MDLAPTPSSQRGATIVVMAMQSFFYWSDEVIMFFSQWTTDTVTEYLLTLLAVFFLAALYHWLTSFRTNLVSQLKATKDSTDRVDDLEAGSTITTHVQLRYPKVTKLLLALLFGVNSAIGYLLMLAVMGFNVGVFLAVVLGLTTANLFTDL